MCKPWICWGNIYYSLRNRYVKVGNVDIARAEVLNLLGCGPHPDPYPPGVGEVKPYCDRNPYIKCGTGDRRSNRPLPNTNCGDCPKCTNSIKEICQELG
jgi:hypothetical protein